MSEIYVFFLHFNIPKVLPGFWQFSLSNIFYNFTNVKSRGSQIYVKFCRKRITHHLLWRGALEILLPVASSLFSVKIDVSGRGKAVTGTFTTMEVQSIAFWLAGVLVEKIRMFLFRFSIGHNIFDTII